MTIIIVIIIRTISVVLAFIIVIVIIIIMAHPPRLGRIPVVQTPPLGRRGEHMYTHDAHTHTRSHRTHHDQNDVPGRDASSPTIARDCGQGVCQRKHHWAAANHSPHNRKASDRFVAVAKTPRLVDDTPNRLPKRLYLS